jgi:hypothetical protein
MPTKDLSPKEFEELSKHIFDIEHRKGNSVKIYLLLGCGDQRAYHAPQILSYADQE